MLPSSFDLDSEPTELVPDGAFLGSPELKGTISLETAIGNPYVVDQEALLTVWSHLSAVSVEAACLGRPNLFDFADNDSLLFAAIRTPVRVVLPPGVELGTLGLPDGAAVVSTDSSVSLSDPVAIYDLVDRYHKQLHPPPPSSPDDGESTSSSSDDPPPCSPTGKEVVFKWETIGIVYLTQSPLPNEVHIGVGLLPTFRGKGMGIKACAFATQWAIETIAAHRVQARILASPDRSRAQRLFTALGFTHEGIQRRAVPDATGAWVDVTCMGVGDLDWIMRRRLRAVPRNMWEELFARHQREREELLRWEETQEGLGVRRTSSMETVRDGKSLALVVPEVLSEDDAGSECGTPSTSSGSSASRRSPSPMLVEPGPAAQHPWRSPLFAPNAENEGLDDAFSDTEWITDILRSSEEPVPRPLSAPSWSSFESIGSPASVTGSVTEGMSGMVM